MFRLPPARIAIIVLLLIAMIATVVVDRRFHVFDRVWFAFQSWRQAADWQTRSLWLPDYHVVVEARPIEGVENISALTYDPDRKTLFTDTSGGRGNSITSTQGKPESRNT